VAGRRPLSHAQGGNHYFRKDSVHWSHVSATRTHTTCPWKGEASYYDVVVVNGETNGDASWYYHEPFLAAIEIQDRVAFWKGVTVEET
jgi:uncharacterized protein (DUF427 family)